MTQRALIRLAWIPGLLLLGLALWLGRRDAGRPDPIPSPTPEEANRRAAPILQKIQQLALLITNAHSVKVTQTMPL